MNNLILNFKYKQGKKIGYNISIPDQYGNVILLNNVSKSDKSRICKEANKILLDLEKSDPFYIYQKEDLIVEKHIQ